MGSRRLTFRKQARGRVVHVTTQEPSVTEIIIPLNEFNAITLREAQLIVTAGCEIMDDEQDGAGRNQIGVTGLAGSHWASGLEG